MSKFERVDVGNVKGDKGDVGDTGRGILNIEDLGYSNNDPLRHNYRIIFDDGSEPYEFTVKDGENLRVINDVESNSNEAVSSRALYQKFLEKANTSHTHNTNAIYVLSESMNNGVLAYTETQTTLHNKLKTLESEINSLKNHQFIHIVEDLEDVDDLDTQGIYLQLSQESDSGNYYEEYVWNEEENDWEHIGAFNINLSNYPTISQVSNTYATKTEVSNLSSSVSSQLSSKENTSNKASSITTNTGSTSKYPTIKAVEDYVDAKVGNVQDYIHS